MERPDSQDKLSEFSTEGTIKAMEQNKLEKCAPSDNNDDVLEK